jgi:hypothetical protein
MREPAKTLGDLEYGDVSGLKPSLEEVSRLLGRMCRPF